MQDEPQPAEGPAAAQSAPPNRDLDGENQGLILRACIGYGCSVFLWFCWLRVSTLQVPSSLEEVLQEFVFGGCIVTIVSAAYGMIGIPAMQVALSINRMLGKPLGPSRLLGFTGGIVGFWLTLLAMLLIALMLVGRLDLDDLDRESPSYRIDLDRAFGANVNLGFTMQIACYLGGALSTRLLAQSPWFSVRFALRDWFVLTAGAAFLWWIASLVKLGVESFLQVLCCFVVTQMALCVAEFLLSDQSTAGVSVAPTLSREPSGEQRAP